MEQPTGSPRAPTDGERRGPPDGLGTIQAPVAQGEYHLHVRARHEQMLTPGAKIGGMV